PPCPTARRAPSLHDALPICKYSGSDLVYSAGAIQYDPYNGNQTYALGSDLTGGSSGGPWLTSFTASTGVGTLTSLNSYIYTSIRSEEHTSELQSRVDLVCRL